MCVCGGGGGVSRRIRDGDRKENDGVSLSVLIKVIIFFLPLLFNENGAFYVSFCENMRHFSYSV